MEFFRRAAGRPQKVAALPGAFNPPTRAHLALARAALAHADEVVFVLPREFPHKDWQGAPFADRVRMLEASIADEPRFSVAASEKGLFIEIARVCRAAYGPETQIYVLCGRDAAERIVNWDYGAPGAFAAQLEEYQLLVTPRNGAYRPPEAMRERIHPLRLAEACDEVSATEVRERKLAGRPWSHLVPEAIVEMVERLY